MVEIRRYERRAVDREDALHGAFLGRLDHGCVDLLDGGGLLGLDDQIDHGDVGGRHAHRGAVQLARQFRQDEADSTGRTRRGRDDRHRRRAAPMQILVHDSPGLTEPVISWKVNQELIHPFVVLYIVRLLLLKHNTFHAMEPHF